MTLDDFTTGSLQDPAVLALAARVRYEIDATQGTAGPDVLRGSVELTLNDGATLQLELDEPAGSPARPASEAALIAKFKECCRRARSNPAEAMVAAWVERILTLESSADAGSLARSL